MAIRDSWATQASGPTGTIDVEDARLAIGALLCRGNSTATVGLGVKNGFRPRGTGSGDDPGLVYPTGTPDGNVHVATFQGFFGTTRSPSGGPYIWTLDADATVNVLSTPADPTNPRNDLIIAQQSDTFYGDANSNLVIRQVVGTPSGSPSDPAVTGSGDYIPLARVRVNAGATTISGSNITDLRTSGHAKSLTGGIFTVALGGILPVASQAERDALGSPYGGLTIWRRDAKRLEVYEGASGTYVAMPGGIVASWKLIPTITGLTAATNVISNSWTPPAVGNYRIEAKVPFDLNGGVADAKARLKVGGTEYDSDVRTPPAGDFVGYLKLSCSVDITSLSAVTVATTIERASGTSTFLNCQTLEARTEIFFSGNTGIRA